MHRPPEPPIPTPEGFPLTYLASRPSRLRRIARQVTAPGVISSTAVLGIAATMTVVVLSDNPARSAADHAAVIAKPTAVPGIPVLRGDQLPGDGTWIVGKEVKPGVYRSTAGKLCYWERLAGLSTKYVDLIANGGFRNGPQLVEILPTDYAFGSQGCGKWERVSDQ